MKWVAVCIGMLSAIGGFSRAPAQAYTNQSHVFDGAGRWTAGGTLSNITAVAQPGGVGTSTNGALRNMAGFLNTFILQPWLDTDGDGLANEVDPDNDCDLLEDAVEIAGSAFSPVTDTDPDDPDSDGDGAMDGEEAAAGTDPLDDTVFLRIVSVNHLTNGVEVGWVARSNKTYRVMGEGDMGAPAPFTNEVDSVVATGAAAAPWYVLTNYYTHTGAAATNLLFYRVEVQP